MAFDQLYVLLAGVVALVAAGFVTHSRFNYVSDVPAGLPWVGQHRGFLSDLRTRIASLGSVLETIESGYRKYSKSGLNFVLPGFDHSMVLVPVSQVKWITDQAEHVLNANEMQREVLQTDYSLLDSTLARNPIHELVVRRDLTRYLGALIPDIEGELNVGVDELWGKDTEKWSDVVVFSTMMKIVARTSNRIFVGLPLCRNDDYLDNAGRFAQDIPISAALLRMIPRIFKPFLSWIPLLPNRWHLYKASRYLLPFIRGRISELDAAKASGEKVQWNDFTGWYLNQVADHPDPAERTPEKIVKRLMVINFAAIHTSTFTATNILFDLFSSPTAAEDVKEIREEIQTVLAENNGKWDKNAVAKLIKTDSAVRESLRISTFMSHGMDRMVVDPKGVTMNDGLHLPQGTRIGTSTYSIHHDNNVYENARTYDAFRFSRVRAGVTKSSVGDGVMNKEDLAKVLEAKNLSTVTTSDTFLSFGHGRHACPGRFFAATEMKLLLAYIVLNYDVKPFDTRPANTFLAGSILPPMKATISVKRRKV
ncbi:cytochrome P450 [Leptodontidium sp. MPI-SDFR-AT-0119]|nr:cytochrome P450 [Leptodontidium sp. MPI-SDFR-AT-0119]